MELKEILFELCSAHGVSGGEDSAFAAAKRFLEPVADSVYSDANGNLYAVAGNKDAEKTILLDAHLDRIGLIVTDINDNGFVKVDKCGGIDIRTLQDTVFETEDGLKGTVCCLPPHLSDGSEDKASPISKTWLDFGMTAEEMKQHVQWAGIREGEFIDFPAVAEGEDLDDFQFYEASSFRKIGNKYIYLYSGFSGQEYGLTQSNATLRYAYADTPRGPWKSGGVLVDARGPVLSRDGSALETHFGDNNTHGSLAEINGQWYVFYHRAPRGFGFARQAMVAPVAVQADEKPVSEGGVVRITAYDPYKGAFTVKAADGSEYRGAEVTSEGFFIYGLPPYRYYSAGYACYLSNPNSIQDNWDVWDNRMDITEVKAGDILGYKYIGFGGLPEGAPGLPAFEGVRPGHGTVFNLFVAARTAQAFKVGVWIDGPWEGGAWNGTKVGEVVIPAGASADVRKYTVSLGDAVDGLTGKHALFLVAEGPAGEPLCDIMGFGFTKKGQKMAFPVPPAVKISVGGQALEMPAHPVWTTEQNGLTDNTFYEVSVPSGVTGQIAVKAPMSVDVAIDQDACVVRCTYQGKTKTFTLK